MVLPIEKAAGYLMVGITILFISTPINALKGLALKLKLTNV